MKDDRLLEMQVFKAIVEHDGFTAAAHALETSQPFVSRTITRLEKRLGAKLIHRTTRRHRLTPEGERYLETCRHILQAIDEAEGELAGEAEPSGDLRVSAPLAFGTDRILPLLPSFMTRYPEVKVHLSLNDAVVSLIDDNVDVAIRMGRLHNSQMVARKLCNLHRVVVAAPAYIARYGEVESPEALRYHNCLEWHGGQDHLNHWPFLVEGEPHKHVAVGNFRSNNGLSLAAMCFAGMGIMRMAEHLAVPAIREGRLIRLLERYEVREATAIHAVYLPERQLGARTRAFVDHLVEALRHPTWEEPD